MCLTSSNNHAGFLKQVISQQWCDHSQMQLIIFYSIVIVIGQLQSYCQLRTGAMWYASKKCMKMARKFLAVPVTLAPVKTVLQTGQ